MAAQTDKETPTNIVAPRRGLFTDVSPELQIPGTYRFALNALDDSNEGDIVSISNEPSNSICTDIPKSYALLGSVYMEDSTNMVFFLDTDTENSIIATVDKNCKYTEHVVSNCLGFDERYPIEGIYRIKNGCERIVYFVDHNNPDRFINLDQLSDFIDSEYQEGIDPVASKWNCKSFNIDRLTLPACITLKEISESGGTIPAGVVQFSVQHVDSNLNGAGYSVPSPTIPIIKDSYSLDYDSIGGADSNEPTTKSVTINISELDLSYEYIEIIAIITTAGVTQTYFVERIPITAENIDYTFRGVKDGSEPIQIVYTKDILSSKTITQLENRLIRANVKSPRRDYSNFQRDFANKITSKYVTIETEVDKLNQLYYNSPAKSGSYYFNNRSYMRDEVYAFGIYYIFNDGTQSPVFHIPGRIADVGLPVSGNGSIVHSRAFANGGWDTTSYTIVNSGSQDYLTSISITEVNHLSGYSVGDTIERWKVYNTAFRDNTPVDPVFFSSGYMGYHETETNYPLTQDCNGEYIYGELAGTPIRHHRMPDSCLEPHYDSGNIYPLGVRFENVDLPPDVVKAVIVRADRTELNKTVYDKGIAFYTRTAGLNGVQVTFQAPYLNRHYSSTVGNNNNILPDGPESAYSLGTLTTSTNVNASKINFHSALTKFSSPLLKPTHVKAELVFRGETSYGYGNNLGEDETTTSVQYTYDTVYRLAQNSRTNVAVVNYAYVGENSIENTYLTNKFINNFQPETFAMDLRSEAYLIDFAAHDLYAEAQTAAMLGASTYKVDYAGYYSLKSSSNEVYTILSALNYVQASLCPVVPLQLPIANNAMTVFGGDIFISRMDYLHTFRAHSTDGSDVVNANGNTYNQGEVDKHNFSHVVSFWGESEINSELRNSLTNQNYYPKYFQTPSELWEDFCKPALDSGNYIPNYYYYNSDYSKINNEVIFIQLPETWKYCSDCLNEFPNRVYYSEQSFQEELFDMYLKQLLNNYRDILSSKGDITKIYNYKNTLLLDVTESRFILPSSTQSIQASEANITIGTGEFFSFPVKEISDSDVGFFGNQSQWASNLTEHGLFSLDAESGNIFLFNNGLKLLSSPEYGMHNWFKENLPLNLPKQFENLKPLGANNAIYENKDNPINRFNGVGYTSVFDSRYQRWLLTKHDFRLTELGEEYVAGTGYPDYYRLDFVDGKWTLYSIAQALPIEPRNRPDLFEDIGWTISFSVKRNAWISFHSYRPSNYIDLKLNFLTFNNYHIGSNLPEDIGNLWKHGEKFNYQTFYNIYYPHILEVVNTNPGFETTVWNSISFLTQAKQWNSTYKSFVDKRFVTFDKAIIYNNYQNSGELTLVTQEDLANLETIFVNQQGVTPVEMRERTYSINNFRDMVDNYDVPMFTSAWDPNNTGPSSYNGQYYIDKVINPIAINLNKNWWEQDVFRSKYLTLRLFFSILDNIKLTTHLKVFDKIPSVR